MNDKINYLIAKLQNGGPLSVRSILDANNSLNNHTYSDSEIAFLDDYYNRINKSHGVTWDDFVDTLSSINWDYDSADRSIKAHEGVYSPFNNTITIMRKKITNPQRVGEVSAHELSHALDYAFRQKDSRVDWNGDNKDQYSDEADQIIYAYNNKDLTGNGMYLGRLESISTNSETRYNIIKHLLKRGKPVDTDTVNNYINSISNRKLSKFIPKDDYTSNIFRPKRRAARLQSKIDQLEDLGNYNGSTDDLTRRLDKAERLRSRLSKIKGVNWDHGYFPSIKRSLIDIADNNINDYSNMA